MFLYEHPTVFGGRAPNQRPKAGGGYTNKTEDFSMDAFQQLSGSTTMQGLCVGAFSASMTTLPIPMKVEDLFAC